MVAASYPFLDLLWTIFLFFLWVAWFFLLFRVFADIFRRHDLSGWGKAAWLIFTIALPFLGVFVYLIAQGDGITQRDAEGARAAQARLDDRIRAAAGTNGGSAVEIERAKRLLDSGAITPAEYDALKQKALA